MSDTVSGQPDPTELQPRGYLARRPLAGAGIALIMGIAFYGKLPDQPAIWIGVAIVCLIGSVIFRSRNTTSTSFVLLTTFCTGTALAQLIDFHYPASHISQFTTQSQRLAELELRFDNPPRIYAPTFGQAYPMPPKQVAIAEVTAVRTWDRWEPSSGKILVTINEPNPELATGQTVRVFGMLDRPAQAMNPGQFDWASYYRKQGVLASIHIPHAANVVITDRSPPTIVQCWRQWTRDRLADGFIETQSTDHALLRALVLGDTDPELRDIQEQFRATGTSHHLAISGAHIALMGGMIFLIARLLRLTPRTAWWIAMIFVVVYGLAAMPSAPVVRSVLMWLALGFATIGRRARDFVQLLAIVVIAMLIWQPLDVFDAGFQLTFGIVLGLILLTHPFSQWLSRAKSEDTPRPTDHLLIKAAAYIDSQIILVISAGLVAWLVSMPIIASHFTQLNPYAVFASILLAPVVFLSLTGGVLKIIASALWPPLSGAFAWIAQKPVGWMRDLVAWLASFPQADVPLPAPAWWLVVVFYLLLVAIAIQWKRGSLRILSRVGMVAALIALLVLPYQTSIASSASKPALRVTLLSVGAGQCAVIEPPSDRVMLIDAGSLSLSDPVRKAIAPYLRFRGITSLDTIAISHANSDHFSAVAELVEAYGAREVLVADGFSECVKGNTQATEMLAALNRAERPPRTVLPGQTLPLGSNTSVNILWPPPNTGFEPNDQSLVVRLTHNGVRVLFTGDIQDDAMKKLLKTPDDLRADVLIAPHHGSSEKTTPAFLAAVAPKAIICSDDRTPTGKQNRFDEMAKDYPVYHTHLNGAVTIDVFDAGNFSVTPFLQSRNRTLSFQQQEQ